MESRVYLKIKLLMVFLTICPALVFSAYAEEPICELSYSKLLSKSNSPSNSRPALEALRKYLSKIPLAEDKYERNMQHQLLESRGGYKLKIGYLGRHEKRFMILALGALREGSIHEIDMGEVIGPKVLSLVNEIRKTAEKEGAAIRIFGILNPESLERNRIQDIENTATPRGSADAWAQSETNAYFLARRELDVDSCKVGTMEYCTFELRVKDGRSTLSLRPE